MKFSEAFGSRFLRAADLPEGPGVRAVINGVQQEELGPKKEKKYVLTFSSGAKKSLVLNKTNGSTIAAAYGDAFSDWEGCPIILYRTETAMQGEMVDCVRVKIPRTQPAPKPSPISEEAVFDPNEIPI